MATDLPPTVSDTVTIVSDRNSYLVYTHLGAFFPPASPSLPAPAHSNALSPEAHSEVAMHLRDLIIDGFKTYGVRTVFKDFDRSFNASVGENGHGKSNALDAIVFVLGITDMKQVCRHGATPCIRGSRRR